MVDNTIYLRSNGLGQLLTVGKTYVVLGLMSWLPHSFLLTVTDTGTGHWLPIELFDLVHPELPTGWSAAVSRNVPKLWTGDPTVRVTIGFAEMVSNPSYYEDLLDGKEEAISSFGREFRKQSLVEEVREQLEGYAENRLTANEVSDWAIERIEFLTVDLMDESMLPLVDVISEMTGFASDGDVDRDSLEKAIQRIV
ncbi:hypothetical protein AB4Z09_25530 [Rhodococcus sp. TAF43]|uniref:hypothetical protein n=1 Tax=Rhodococcus sp. TAF43 TaxID=3237483 RepID=UPI003F9D711E